MSFKTTCPHCRGSGFIGGQAAINEILQRVEDPQILRDVVEMSFPMPSAEEHLEERLTGLLYALEYLGLEGSVVRIRYRHKWGLKFLRIHEGLLGSGHITLVSFWFVKMEVPGWLSQLIWQEGKR